MCNSLLKGFWNCGDNNIIEFAMLHARLNRMEKNVIELLLDECLSQEQAAERLDISTRSLQNYWYSGSNKLLNIPWVTAYAKELTKE